MWLVIQFRLHDTWIWYNIHRERETYNIYIYIHICTHMHVCVFIYRRLMFGCVWNYLYVCRLGCSLCSYAWWTAISGLRFPSEAGSCFSGRKWHGFVGTCAWKRNHHILSFKICSKPACQVDSMHHIPLMNVALRTGKCPGNRRSLAVQQLLEAAERYQ